MNRGELNFSVQAELERLQGRHPDLTEFLTQMAGHVEVVLFGGFVRDAIHNLVHGEQIDPRDLDVVIDADLPAELATPSRTNFGGYRRTFPDGFEFDYWELASTYAFKQGILAVSLENLLISTVFTINACYFEWSSGRLRYKDAVDDISHRRIAFNCRDYLHHYPQYQAYRAMSYADRLGYTLEPDVLDFVTTILQESEPKLFAREVLKHRRVSEAQLAELVQKYT